MYTKGSREIEFIGFVEFLGFVGLVKQGTVDNCTPITDDNSINTTNTKYTINKSGIEGKQTVLSFGC